jgi:hypothetical protein
MPHRNLNLHRAMVPCDAACFFLFICRARPAGDGLGVGGWVLGTGWGQGRAYERLLPIFGSERIIVIAQLDETLVWLRDCVSSPQRCREVTGSADHLLCSHLPDFRCDSVFLVPT